MLMTNLKKFPMIPKIYLGKFTMMVMTYLKMILMRTKTYFFNDGDNIFESIFDYAKDMLEKVNDD